MLKLNETVNGSQINGITVNGPSKRRLIRLIFLKIGGLKREFLPSDTLKSKNFRPRRWKRTILASWPSKILKIFACGAKNEDPYYPFKSPISIQIPQSLLDIIYTHLFLLKLNETVYGYQINGINGIFKVSDLLNTSDSC